MRGISPPPALHFPTSQVTSEPHRTAQNRMNRIPSLRVPTVLKLYKVLEKYAGQRPFPMFPCGSPHDPCGSQVSYAKLGLDLLCGEMEVEPTIVVDHRPLPIATTSPAPEIIPCNRFAQSSSASRFSFS